MKRLPNIERYLNAEAMQLRERDSATGARVRPFITISRQSGAGGHLLAAALLEVFAAQDDEHLFGGWQVFDRKLCEIVADTPAYSGAMDSLLAEEYRTRTDEFFYQILTPTIDQDVLMMHVFRVVRAVASIGKSIIVGRAGSEVTRDMASGISVRLIAPEEVRIPRVMEHYGLDEAAARAEARRLDAARARLLKAHFKVNIDDPLRYDVTWNTGEVPVRAIAESIATLLRQEVAAARSAVPV